MGEAEEVIGHYLIPQDRWYALRVRSVQPAEFPLTDHLRIIGDRVDLDEHRQPRETNVHKGHVITVRHAARGVVREHHHGWLNGPSYWWVRPPVGQMALF